MSGQRYTPELKDEALRQVTERGYSVQEIAERLGVSQHSFYQWLEKPISDHAIEDADNFNLFARLTQRAGPSRVLKQIY